MTDARKPPVAPLAGPEASGHPSEAFQQAGELGVAVVPPGSLRQRLAREPTLPRATPADVARYAGQLVALVRAAHAEGAEVGAWVGAALRQVAAELPGGAEALVEQRPGSREAGLVYQLLTECADSAARARLPHLAARVTARHLPALVQLVREAHTAHVEIAGWLAQGLGAVASELPGKADELLKHQGSRTEFSLVRRLVYGTIGRPAGT